MTVQMRRRFGHDDLLCKMNTIPLSKHIVRAHKSLPMGSLTVWRCQSWTLPRHFHRLCDRLHWHRHRLHRHSLRLHWYRLDWNRCWLLYRHYLHLWRPIRILARDNALHNLCTQAVCRPGIPQPQADWSNHAREILLPGGNGIEVEDDGADSRSDSDVLDLWAIEVENGAQNPSLHKRDHEVDRCDAVCASQTKGASRQRYAECTKLGGRGCTSTWRTEFNRPRIHRWVHGVSDCP